MFITYDSAADAIYVYLSTVEEHDVARTVMVDDARLVKYDAGDEPIGLELLFVSEGIDLEGLPRADEVADVLRRFPRPA